ncbi:MAG: CBS domain-containing protein [Kiritimatiellia bacterium]|jgi:CBS domain-containing protein
MKVRELMTSFPYTVHASDHISQVVKVLVTTGVHQAPVLRAGILVGMISESDVRICLGPEYLDTPLEKVDCSQMKASVHAYMKPCPVKLSPDQDASEAARALLNARAQAAAVMDNDEVIGVLSITDLLSVAATALEEWEDRWNKD